MDPRRRPADARRPDRGDEAAANRVRRLLRASGVVPIEPDERIAVVLCPGERLLAMRRGAWLERRHPATGDGLRGDLYLTDRRLVHLGRGQLEYPLDAIREAVVSGRRLLLVVDGGRGVSLDVGDPQTLQVQIAAARTGRAG